jgi:hypothetical protein
VRFWPNARAVDALFIVEKLAPAQSAGAVE